MKDETFEKRTYLEDMTMADAQTYFKYGTNMTDVKFNFKNDKKFTNELWKCDSCMTAIESQSQILWCPAYQDLRSGKSLIRL